MARASILFAVLAGVCYANSLHTPFFFDTVSNLSTPAIRRLIPPDWLLHSGARPFAMLTFALNYAVDGLRPFGYHVVNVFIHWANACLVFHVARETLRRGRFPESLRSAAPSLAWMIAVLWLVHPLQTNAVTNVIQRLESLMSLFYLLTIACFLQATESSRPARWYALSIAALVFGVGCKEPAATAPLVVLCFDRTLCTASFREALGQRPWYYLGLFPVWGFFAVLIHNASPGFAPSGVGSTDELTPGIYLQTQAVVLPLYLRLIVAPIGLTADYGLPYVTSFAVAAPYGGIVVGLLLATAYGLFRGRTWSLVGVCFFLILAPTSSVLPLRDAVFEHRIYLPSAAVIAGLVCGGYLTLLRLIETESVRRRVIAGAGLLLVTLLSVGTIVRNQDYASQISYYSDNWAKTPHNPRVNYNLGFALLLENQPEAALPYLQRAVELEPAYVAYRRGLALAWEKAGRPAEAIRELRICVERDPRYGEAWVAIGELLSEAGALAEAEAALHTANGLQPTAASLYNEGALRMRRGDTPDEAVRCFRRALELDPDFSPARDGLDRLNAAAGRNRP